MVGAKGRITRIQSVVVFSENARTVSQYKRERRLGRLFCRTAGSLIRALKVKFRRDLLFGGEREVIIGGGLLLAKTVGETLQFVRMFGIGCQILLLAGVRLEV